MAPVVATLTAPDGPLAGETVLWWALAFGADLGGNATAVGASVAPEPLRGQADRVGAEVAHALEAAKNGGDERDQYEAGDRGQNRQAIDGAERDRFEARALVGQPYLGRESRVHGGDGVIHRA
jgi:hypothetical protein